MVQKIVVLIAASMLVFAPLKSMDAVLLKKVQERMSQEKKNDGLYVSAIDGKLNRIQLFLQGGAQIDAHHKEFQNETALHGASRKGLSEAAELLLSKNADTEAVDDNGFTALHCVATLGHISIVKLLLAKKAVVDPKATVGNVKGNTPLHGAAQNGHTEVIQLLVDAGADVEACNELGHLPLHYTAMAGHCEALRLLLTHSKDKDAQCRKLCLQGFSPLHWAIAKGFGEATKILIENGADPEMPAGNGLTPLGLAEAQNNALLKKFLKSVIKSRYGCSICAKKKDECKLMLCSGCKIVYYCSKECQTSDWKDHKPVCWKKVAVVLIK